MTGLSPRTDPYSNLPVFTITLNAVLKLPRGPPGHLAGLGILGRYNFGDTGI